MFRQTSLFAFQGIESHRFGITWGWVNDDKIIGWYSFKQIEIVSTLPVSHKKCSWSEFLQFSSKLKKIALNGGGCFISCGSMEQLTCGMIGSLGTYCVISSSFWPMLIWHMRLGLSLGASKDLQIKFGFLTRIPKHIKPRNDLVMQIIKHICICLLKPITEIKLLNSEWKSVGERERNVRWE